MLRKQRKSRGIIKIRCIDTPLSISSFPQRKKPPQSLGTAFLLLIINDLGFIENHQPLQLHHQRVLRYSPYQAHLRDLLHGSTHTLVWL